MKKTIAAAALIAALSAGAASAQQYPPFSFGGPQQPYGGPGYGSSITFYEGENFYGRQITISGEERDFSRIGFNDRARSARTNGSFMVCEHSEFRGRCQRISGSVRSLEGVGLSGRISSAREDRGGGYPGGPGGYDPDDRDDDYGGGYGGGYGNPRRDGVQGRTVVFFARPNAGGNDIAARGQGSADQFCRASGHGSAVYFAQGERSRRAVDQDGRLVDAPALRDVLCRTR